MKPKKLISLALGGLALLSLPLALGSCGGFSETEYAIVGEGLTSDVFIYDQYENSTVRITGIENMPAQLIIPETINGMPVVEIAEKAFADSDKLLYLELPAGSIRLGRGFCSDCTALIAVQLSDAVSAIPDSAFENCSNLAFVDGIGSVTAIGEQAFAACASLSSLDMTEALTSIGSEAFRGCTALARVKIPSSVAFIGGSAFWGCSGLASAEIECTADIPEYCFLDCTSLTAVTVGDTVTAIKDEAFRNCRALYCISIGKECRSISDYAFHACDELTVVTFADSRGVSIGEGNESLEGKKEVTE